MSEKIAILTDSGTNIPPEYAARENVFVVPLSIVYAKEQFQDNVDLFPEDVFRRFKKEIPKTGLPTGEALDRTFGDILAKGYEKLVIISISSNLSGTFNCLRLAAENYPQLKTLLIDTKNISLGAGFTVIRACTLLDEGLPFSELEEKLKECVKNAKIYFCLKTLEYLIKGGRLGLVSATIGTLLGIKPIISCNEEGIYYTVAKARNRKESLKRLLALATEYAGSERCLIAVMHTQAEEDAQFVLDAMQEALPNATVVESSLSAALTVHTGPGLIGVGVLHY